MNKAEFVTTLNEFGHRRMPFFFMVDFELEKPQVIPLSEIDDSQFLFDFQGFTNAKRPPQQLAIEFSSYPMDIKEYATRFENVMRHLHQGDSFLTNLTIKTPIHTNRTLLDIFHQSVARYKLFYKNEFIFFSPESFVKVKDGRIYSYPMKGTIDASVVNAKEIVLRDEKELSEHVTIVDLIRNDLSRVADKVEVNKFRYVEELRTNRKTLLQVSSEIVGHLNGHYWDRIGDIMVSLLPAGSVSGAPKEKTTHIIQEAETEKRGYYTGVCGYFDGVQLDSCVMIRFIEKEQDTLYYRSGGGITALSSLEREYHEAIEKIYVPVD